MKRAGARRVAAIAAGVLLLLIPATSAMAHPLGNFTINSFSALRVQPSRVLIDHVTDRAEIPTQQLTASGDPIAKSSSPVQQRAWSRRACQRLAGELTLTVDRREIALAVDSVALRFPPGAGGLPTSRLTCRLSSSASTIGTKTPVDYEDRSDEGRVGWHEIVALGDGATLTRSDVPAKSVSRALTAYPADLLSSPLTVKQAHLVASPGGVTATDPLAGTDAPGGKEQRRGVDRLTAAFTDLVGRHTLSIGVGILAVLLALLLGAFHAFAPGHGKTVMAAYLVADRGSLRQVSLIGLSVTATHTLGVLVLGVLLSTFATFAPEKVYPWLGVASGLLLVGIGASLVRAAWRRRALWARPQLAADHDHEHENDPGYAHGHGHPHPHHHPHPHPHPPSHPHSHPYDHDHDQADEEALERDIERIFAPDERPAALHPTGARASVMERAPAVPLAVVHSHGGRVHSHAPVGDQPVRLRNLLSMGLAGGLVPSPSALVVLVGAIALHRAWFGVVLVVFYGAGMALTLVGIGLLLSRLRGRFVSRVQPGSALARGFAVLPLLTASLICVIGAVLAIRGLGQG